MKNNKDISGKIYKSKSDPNVYAWLTGHIVNGEGRFFVAKVMTTVDFLEEFEEVKHDN